MQGIGTTVGELFSGKGLSIARPIAPQQEVAPAEVPADKVDVSAEQQTAKTKKSRKSRSKAAESAAPVAQAPVTPTPQDPSVLDPGSIKPTPTNLHVVNSVMTALENDPNLTGEQKFSLAKTLLSSLFSGPLGESAPTTPPANTPVTEPAPPTTTPPAAGDTTPPAPTPPADPDAEAKADYEAAQKIYLDMWTARQKANQDCLKIFQDTMAEITKIDQNTYAYCAKGMQAGMDAFAGYLGWDGIPRK